MTSEFTTTWLQDSNTSSLESVSYQRNRMLPWNDTSGDFNSFRSPFESSRVFWTFFFLYGLVALACVLGNALVIFVILRHRKMRNVTNFLLANLAFADLGVGIFCVMPTLNLFIQQHWLIGKVMCKLCFFVQSVSYTASVLILTVISIERYVAIIHPILSRQVSSCGLHTVIVVIVWSVAVAYSAPIGLAYDLLTLNQNGEMFQYCLRVKDLKLHFYITVNFILWYVLPLILMVVMYTCVSVVLWRSSNTTRTCSDRISRDDKLRLTRNTTQTGTNTMTTTQTGVHTVTTTANQAGQLEMTRVNYSGGNTPLGGRTPQGRMTPSSSVGSRLIFQADLKNGLPSNLPIPQNLQSGVRTRSPSPTSRSPTAGYVTTLRNKSFGKSQQQLDAMSTKMKAATATSGRGVVATSVSGRTTSAGHKKSDTRSIPLMARRKVIRLLITIIVTFAVCVLPQHLRLLWHTWGTQSQHYHPSQVYLPPITYLCFFLNNALNPFLYAFFSNNFRRSMAATCSLPGWCCGRSSGIAGGRRCCGRSCSWFCGGCCGCCRRTNSQRRRYRTYRYDNNVRARYW